LSGGTVMFNSGNTLHCPIRRPWPAAPLPAEPWR
jgi:hypothetical protein